MIYKVFFIESKHQLTHKTEITLLLLVKQLMLTIVPTDNCKEGEDIILRCTNYLTVINRLKCFTIFTKKNQCFLFSVMILLLFSQNNPRCKHKHHYNQD